MAEAAVETPAAKPPGRKRGWLAWGLLVSFAILALAVRLAPGTEVGRAFIERQASGVKVGRLGHLRVFGLTGDPWQGFGVARLEIYDQDGTWLVARAIKVRWRPAELLRARVRVESLAVGRVTIVKRFTLTPAGRPHPSPVVIEVDHGALTLETLPAFSVNRGLFAVGGRVLVTRSGQPVGALDARSLLHPGDRLTAGFDFAHRGAFDLNVAAREAQGGALAGSLGLATNRNFSLDVTARGRQRVGDFTMAVRSGELQAAEARGRWTSAGGEARGRISLAASTLLTPYQALIGPEVRFQVDGRNLSKTLYALDVAAGGDKAAVTAIGDIDPNRRSVGPHGLRLALRVDEPALWIKTGASGPLRLRGGLGGDQKHWVFSGAGSLERPTLSGVTFARVAGPIAVEGGGRQTVIKTTLRGEGGTGEGLAAGLLGNAPVVSTDVVLIGDRRVNLRKITLDGAQLKVAGAGSQGVLGDLAFSGQAVVADLARAKLGAHGGLKATWSAKQSGRGPWVFGVDGHGLDFHLGSEPIDGLLGSTPGLTLKGAVDKGGVNLEQVNLAGRAGSLTAAGRIGSAGALKLAVAWRLAGPIPIGPIEIAGAAKGTGDIGGTLASPTADLIADLAAVDLPNLPLRDAHLVTQLRDLTGAVAGRFSLVATSQYGPARAAADFSLAGGGLSVSGLDANAGGLKAGGAFALVDNAPSTADLVWSAGPGAFLAAGHATGHARLVDAAGGARADLAIDAVEAQLRGGPLFHTLRLTASGPLPHLPYKADASGFYAGTPFRLIGSGVFSQGGHGAEDAVTFGGSGRVRGVDVRTLAPARVAFGVGRLDAALTLAAAGGQVDLNLENAGARVSGHATLTRVTLSAFDPDYVGVVSGEGQFAGEGAALNGHAVARVSKVGLKGQKGVSPLDGTVEATLAGASLRLDTDLTSGAGSTARITADLPVVATAAPFRLAVARLRPMRGTFAIDAELAPLWTLAMGDEQTLAGHLVANGDLGGALADPRLTGAAALSAGRFSDSTTGLKLQGVSLRAALRDNAIDVSSFQGRDAGKGTVLGSGRIGLDRDGVSDLQLVLREFRLIDNDLGQATASGKVTVNRAASGKVKLAGALVIDRAQIAPNTPAPSGVVAMPVVEIHRKIDPDAVPVTPDTRAAPVELDVKLSAPSGVFIRGRGLNVEFSLDARVTGSTTAPDLSGVARVLQGDYNFAGQRFTLGENGSVRLASAPEAIRLDLTATRDNPTLTAVIRITGSAAKPIIELTSTPVLPRDEVLSQVLFGASVSSLNGFQAAQLASALSGLASGGGFDVIGGLRNLAHLDRLAINSSVAGGNSIAGGKYLTDKVYLELSGGAKEGPGAQVEWRVRKSIAIVSKVTSQGDQQISVRWRRDY